MENVLLIMLDTKTGKKVERIIDGLNAYSSGSVCWELKGESEQEKQLKRWIKERGNEQHNTILELKEFRFLK